MKTKTKKQNKKEAKKQVVTDTIPAEQNFLR